MSARRLWAAVPLVATAAIAPVWASELALPLVEPRAAAVCASEGARCAALAAGSLFANEAPDDGSPTLIFAQRVIERSWGPDEDSVYVVRDIPNWRSEGFAIGLSAAIPGLGQAYAGEKRRGIWFAAVEAAGWIVRQIHVSRGDELRGQAALFAGSPNDSAAAWSFARFEGAGGEGGELRELYSADPDAFYAQIAEDPRFASGWGGNADEQRRHLNALREVSDDRLRVARYSGVALWLNHVVAAVDALRAARRQNVPLIPQLGIKVRSGWRSGGPSVTALIERRF